ncbi:hypothetical protein AGMMS49545_21430 [Betaproteobacteria bacterium]|nr:hypothetical protein AGMMS49545_21430 [Betaproteobacteria bacterium]GHU48598.1 hypothetical protein AGMMS50289_25380 [Betaproteobacteria bacterium]
METAALNLLEKFAALKRSRKVVASDKTACAGRKTRWQELAHGVGMVQLKVKELL